MEFFISQDINNEQSIYDGSSHLWDRPLSNFSELHIVSKNLQHGSGLVTLCLGGTNCMSQLSHMTYCVNARMIRPQTVNLSSHKKMSSMHVNIAQMHEHSCVVTFWKIILMVLSLCNNVKILDIAAILVVLFHFLTL